MAKQLNVNLSFTADTSQAAAQVRNLQQSLTQLINQPVGIGERLSADMLKATQAAAELKMHLQNATNVDTGTLDFSKLNQSLKASGVSLQQYATKLQSLGPQGQQAFMQLARSVANAEVPLRRSNALLAQFSTTLANTARWQLSSSMLHGFISAVSTAWNYSQDLNESLNNIRIVTGKNIDEMSRFADAANRAAKTLSTSTTEYTNASLIYYQQGLSDAEVLGRTETTIKMANASRQSAEIVSDQMTAIWNNFYDGSKSLEYYADVVTALGAATASSSEEIAQGLEKFAAVADTVGLSYEYATAALATVTATTRQSADVVGTAFKTLFARLSDLKLGETLDDGTTLGSYSENLMKIGVNIKDASGQLKDMDTILNETAAKWDNLDKAQQVALAKGVAGIRQYTQFIALMDNWDFMEENLNTVSGSTGTLEKQAKIYEESWEAASKRVKASLETIYASIMDDEFFIDLTNGFAGLIDKVGMFVKSIGGLQGVLFGLGKILTKIFAEQMTQGFQNLAYNIQMSSQVGQKAMQQAKLAQMQKFANSMVNTETSTIVGQTMSTVYKEELMMQQQLIEKSHELSAAEQQKYKVLIEQHRVMGEQSIEIARQLELTKEKIAEDRIQLMGTGLNQGNDMDAVTRFLNIAKTRGQALGEISLQLKDIGANSKVSEQQITQLSASLKQAGMRKSEIRVLAAELKAASGDGEAMGAVIEKINARLSQTSTRTADVIASLLGVRRGTAEYRELSARVAEYIANTKKGTIEQNNLNIALENGSKSGSKFAQMLKMAGQQAQSTASLLSTCISGLMSLGMLVSSINGLIDTIKDPDATPWERFGSAIMSVSMIAMSVMGIFSGVKAAIDLVNSGMLRNTVVTLANSVAQTLSEKAAKRKATVTALNNGLTAIKTKLTRQSAIEDTKEAGANAAGAAALKAENKEKVKAIALDKMRGKGGGGKRILKKPTIDGSKTLLGDGKKFKITDVKKKVKLKPGTGKVLLKGLGSFAAVAAAIAIVAATITTAVNQYNKHNEAAKKAAEQAKEAASAHEKVQQAYSDFTSKLDSYKDAQDGLKNLVKGTEEYEAAVLKANEASMELLNTYKDLTYTVDSDGLIVIDQKSLNEAKKIQKQYLENSQRSNLLAQQHAKNKQLEADAINFQRDKLKSNTTSDYLEDGLNTAVGGVAGGVAGGLAAGALIGSSAGPIGAAVGAAIGLIGAGIATLVTKNENEEKQAAIDSLAAVYEKQGNAKFASDEAFEKLLREELKLDDEALIRSLVENREATANLAKEMAAQNKAEDSANAQMIYDKKGNIIRQAGLGDEEARAVAGMTGSEWSAIVEKEYNDKFKDKGIWGGPNDSTIQEQYAKEMGWSTDTIENQSGNKAKYYDKNGEEVGVISDEVARRYLAELSALKTLDQPLKNVSSKFAELAKSTDIADKALKGFMEEKDFSTLTQEEVNAIVAKAGGEDGQVSEKEAQSYITSNFDLDQDGRVTDQEAQSFGAESYDDLVQSLLIAVETYATTREEAYSNLLHDTQEAIKNNISEETQSLLTVAEMSAMGQQVNKVILNGGSQEDVDFITKDIFNAAQEEAGLLATTLNTVDWTSATPDGLAEMLDEAGIATRFTEEQLHRLIRTMVSGTEGIESISDKLKNFSDMSELSQGDTITEEQYNKLSDSAQSYFTLMADGTYKLTQDALSFYQLIQGDKQQYLQDKTQDELKEFIKNQKVTSMSWEQLASGAQTVQTGLGYSSWEEYAASKASSGLTSYNHDGWSYGMDWVYLGSVLSPDETPSDKSGWQYVGDNEFGEMIIKYWDAEAQEWAKEGVDFYGNKMSGTLEFYGNRTEWEEKSKAYADNKNENRYIWASDEQIVNEQLELLKTTEWGKENGALLSEWEEHLENGVLTMAEAEEISNRVRESGESAYNTMVNGMEGQATKLKQLYGELFGTAENANERAKLYEEAVANASGNENATQAINEAYGASQLAAINEEKNEDLDLDAVNEYSNYLQKAANSSALLSEELKVTADMTEEEAEAARHASNTVALYTTKMNKGIDKLSNSFEDWNSILSESDAGSQEFAEAMIGMKDAMSDVLGVEEDFLTDSFIEKNLSLIAKAAEGSAEAIDELAVKAAEDILLNLALDDTELQTKLQGLQTTLLNNIPDDIKVGATLDTSDFGTAAQELVDNAHMSVEEAQAYFNSLGYEPVFETQLQDYTEQVPITESVEEVWNEPATPFDHDGDENTPPITPRKSHRKTKTWTSGYDTVTYQKQVPILSADGSPKIKSLIKKPNGAMNNRSSSNKGGSSGSGGGSSKPKKAEKKKKSEVVDRYKEITDALTKNTKVLNEATDAADRLYGPARFKQMEKINGLIEKEIKLQQRKRKEALQYLKDDKQRLLEATKDAGIKFEFDENGNISNYTSQMEILYQYLDSAINAANADGNATEEEQEVIDAIQERIDAVKDAQADYEDTLATLQEIDQTLIEKFNEWQDNNYEVISAKIEYEIEMNEDDMAMIDYYLGKLENDAYSSAEALALMFGGNNATQMDIYTDNLTTYKQGIDDLNNAYANGEISQAAYLEGLRSQRDNIIGALNSILQLDNTMQEYYGETLAKANDEIAKYTELMENATSVLDHYSSMMEILGKSTDYAAMGIILSAQSEIAEDAYNVSKANYEMFAKQAAERKQAYENAVASGMGAEGLEMLERQWMDAEAAANEAQDQMLADAETWAEVLTAILDNALAGFAQELEEALTGEFGSFDALSTQMERANSLQEEYLTTTNKIYETNKLMRSAQQEIDKTTNSMAKQKLKQFINETAAMQQQGELSQYELSVQQAKYDLLLAEIALREAQNAKSTVRLQRDSEGNFGYVYTADQNAISDAQQKFEDAQNALYNKGLEGANDYAQKSIELQQEATDAMIEINEKYRNGEYADEQEYQAAMEAAKSYYYEKLQQYSNLYQFALTTDSRIVADAWSSDFGDMATNVEDWHSKVSTYINNVGQAFAQWSAQMQIIREETVGKDLDELANKTQNLTNRSQELVDKLTGPNGVINALSEELGQVTLLTDAYAAQRDQLMLLVQQYEEYLRLLGIDIDAAANDTNALAAGEEVTTKANVSAWSKVDNSTSGSVSGNKKYTVIQYDGSQVLISDGMGTMGWVNKTDLVGFDSGGYTGAWGSYGKMAMLHEKELILNPDDTKNFLASMEFLHRILEVIDLQAMNAQLGGILTSPGFNTNNSNTIEQNVHIEASFPGVQDRNEIEEAFNNLINTASQYANRKL